MLHVEGGEIVRFLSCGGMGHVERGRETVFRVVRGGRNGRTVRANHISRRETSGTYEDRFRLIEQVFQPTHSQRKELYINTLASFYKRHLMSCSFLLNEQLINIE